MLRGSANNGLGRIGVLIGEDGGIGKVHGNSPAAEIGLKRGDRILSADGKKGIKYIDGSLFTWVTIRVKKADTKLIETYTILRADPSTFIED